MICEICKEEHKGFYNLPKRHNKYGEITSWMLVCPVCYKKLKENKNAIQRRSGESIKRSETNVVGEERKLRKQCVGTKQNIQQGRCNRTVEDSNRRQTNQNPEREISKGRRLKGYLRIHGTIKNQTK